MGLLVNKKYIFENIRMFFQKSDPVNRFLVVFYKKEDY